ncbi:MAG: asparaginase domain-containing protein [Clostridia bacterium]|nr:asparaginase domain-containing protein [Clostridia bacterium]
MKILVIFTGGTIGSSEKYGWIAPDGKNDSILIKRYREIYNDDITQFDTVKPCTMLSENLSETELNIIINTVFENIDKDYDGIIVTHGSDTLQYTSAALSYSFSNSDIPVVVVCSAYPLEDARENGTVNFAAAVKLINSKISGGVFVSYKNEKKDTVDIHQGIRVVQHKEASADIYSIDNNPYALYNGDIILNNKYKKSKACKGTLNIKYCKSPEILVIESHPCDSFNYILDDAKAIVIKPYHSGTLNTASVKLQELCKKANEKGIPVFLVNVFGGDSYESCKLFDNIGITVLPLCTFVSVYVKCWLAISLGKDVKEFVLKPLAEEFLE